MEIVQRYAKVIIFTIKTNLMETKILCNLDSLSKIKSINNDNNIIKSCNIVISSFGRARICNFSQKSL